MKKILICAALCSVVLMGAALPSYAQNDMQARVEAAKLYEQAVPVETLINETLDAMRANPQLRTALSDQDFEAIRSSYNIPEMRQKLVEVMSKHFTADEIRALAAFYSTPEGRSIMQKMPQYVSDFMPYMQQQSIRILQEMMIRKQQKAQKP